MVSHPCDHCNFVGASRNDLKRHLERKYPCFGATYKCKTCCQPFYSRSAVYTHQKDCTGPKKTKEQELQDKIDILQQEIRDLTKQPDEEIVLALKPVGFGLLADALKAQTYFGKPGEALIPEIPTTEIIIKFGSTIEPAVRIPRHDKDFNGFKILDSIVTNNPTWVETRLKEWLKIKGKLIKGKSIHKSTTDTELFTVKNQAEYESIVRLTKFFADEYLREVENKDSHYVDLQTQKRQHEIDNLKLQMEIFRLKNENP